MSSNELGPPNPKEGLVHELAYLKKENEQQKGIIGNLNEEASEDGLNL